MKNRRHHVRADRGQKYTGASRPPGPLSVLLPLDVYSSVSLSFREPDSTVRARSFTTFSLPLHHSWEMSLLYLEIVEWKVAMVQTTASAHSLNMDDFWFLFLLIKGTLTVLIKIKCIKVSQFLILLSGMMVHAKGWVLSCTFKIF